MADNAESNNKCIDTVLQALYPNMSAKQRKARHLRCFGHIINLYAQAFIIGKDAKKVCRQLEIAVRKGNIEKASQL